ncbi:hypothetical protein [Streptomyces mirabilis]|uniref:hypothetical protein n=1 Tax=Streptomyces mirabilis TaxID=68239 RepID=UPI003801764A
MADGQISVRQCSTRRDCRGHLALERETFPRWLNDPLDRRDQAVNCIDWGLTIPDDPLILIPAYSVSWFDTLRETITAVLTLTC